MKYGFGDILNEDIYNKSRVVLITGKYNIFNNMVADTLKDMCGNKYTPNLSLMETEDEFGVEDTEAATSNSVDFDSFIELVDIPSITGKRFCRVELATLNKKQIEKLNNYLKQPSRYGILVILANEYKDYKDWLKNRYLNHGQFTHLFTLNFPKREILKSIVNTIFESKGKEIDSASIDYFLMRMSTEYDKYEEVIDKIIEKHTDVKITAKDMKEYMKGIEYFDIDDFMYEIVKPLNSGKTGNKKIVRMLAALEEKYDPETLARELQKRIVELIDFRIMINTGIISINIRYIFNDVIKLLGPDNKYAKMNEWVFRKKAELASLTSLQDWVYMNIILNKALGVGFANSVEVKRACQRALYSLITRTTFSEDRLNNIIGVDDILGRDLTYLDRVEYIDSNLNIM